MEYYRGLTACEWAEARKIGYLPMRKVRYVSGKESLPRLYFTTDVGLADYYAYLFTITANHSMPGVVVSFPASLLEGVWVQEDLGGFTSGEEEQTEFFIETDDFRVSLNEIEEVIPMKVRKETKNDKRKRSAL